MESELGLEQEDKLDLEVLSDVGEFALAKLSSFANSRVPYPHWSQVSALTNTPLGGDALVVCQTFCIEVLPEVRFLPDATTSRTLASAESPSSRSSRASLSCRSSWRSASSPPRSSPTRWSEPLGECSQTASLTRVRRPLTRKS